MTMVFPVDLVYERHLTVVVRPSNHARNEYVVVASKNQCIDDSLLKELRRLDSPATQEILTAVAASHGCSYKDLGRVFIFLNKGIKNGALQVCVEVNCNVYSFRKKAKLMGLIFVSEFCTSLNSQRA